MLKATVSYDERLKACFDIIKGVGDNVKDNRSGTSLGVTTGAALEKACGPWAWACHAIFR
jgi:hypothetical protein